MINPHEYLHDLRDMMAEAAAEKANDDRLCLDAVNTSIEAEAILREIEAGALVDQLLSAHPEHEPLARRSLDLLHHLARLGR